MTTIRLKSRLPVLTDEQDMREHCAAFGLTLVSWGKNTHEIEVTVQEEVTTAQQQQIATAMTQQIAATLIQLKQ